MRAAIYLRNSDPRQAAAGTQEGQLAAAQRRARELGADVVGVYSDEGKSAKTGALARRGDFARLITDARAGLFDLVIVGDVDRLTRTQSFTELGGQILGPLQDAGIKVATTGGQLLDLGDDGDQLLVLFESWRAARENAARSQRSIRGRQRAIAAGRAPGPPPLGYTLAAGRVVEADAAALPREIYERAAAGESLRTIAAALRVRGAELPRGGAWVASSVARVLRCSTYDTGRWAAHPGAVLDAPVLVDPGVAAAARQRLAGRRGTSGTRTVGVYLLQGIARCGMPGCGGRIHIHGERRRSRNGEKVYLTHVYVCERRRASSNACRLPRLRTDRTDAQLWATVSAWISSPDLASDALAARGGAATEQGRTALADLEDWRRRLEQSTALELEAMALRDSGALSPAALRVRLQDLARRRQLLERQIATAETASLDAAAEARAVADLQAVVGMLRDEAAEAGPAERRRIVRLVCDAWTVLPDGQLAGEAAIEWAARRLVVAVG